MNKKLVKTRNARLNTLEAMACYCGCSAGSCDCVNCSAGGSFQVTEGSNRRANNTISGVVRASALVSAVAKGV